VRIALCVLVGIKIVRAVDNVTKLVLEYESKETNSTDTQICLLWGNYQWLLQSLSTGSGNNLYCWCSGSVTHISIYYEV